MTLRRRGVSITFTANNFNAVAFSFTHGLRCIFALCVPVEIMLQNPMDSLNVECDRCRSAAWLGEIMSEQERETNPKLETSKRQTVKRGAVIITEQMLNLNDSVENVASGVTTSII